ncbi:MAG: short-chain dehydrogenase [Hungatella sp.]|nr:short-chain dehydrogenase [Hungatella sp.]
MNERPSGGRISIGTSSLILIFIILCLTVFGLLSLSSAVSDLKLALKNGESVKGYYEADSKAVEFTAMVEDVLAGCSKAADDEEYLQMIKEGLGNYYREETGTVQADIEMLYGQMLHIELEINREEEAGYRILAWNVYHSVDYDIDRSMPVWTGD